MYYVYAYIYVYVTHTRVRALPLSLFFSLSFSRSLSRSLSLSHTHAHMVGWRVVPIVAIICWALFVIEEVPKTNIHMIVYVVIYDQVY